MADKTGIEWCDSTWNPLRGCTRVSEGCRHCYAERVAARFSGPGQPYEGLAHKVGGEARWTGNVVLAERMLDQPLRWRKPRRIFVNSMSDLFHESVPDGWIDRIFAVMALSPQHVFIVLTKRPERMRDYVAGLGDNRARWQTEHQRIPYAIEDILGGKSPPWPLPNLWLGVSVEDQATADERIPDLLATPAAVRFVSAEPLLAAVSLTQPLRIAVERRKAKGESYGPGIDWVIVGGESGPGARPMHPAWVRFLRDQCAAAGVAFFFKQWGEWVPDTDDDNQTILRLRESAVVPDPISGFSCIMFRVGKKAAGAMLDGREHREWPR